MEEKPVIPNFQITELCGCGASCQVWIGIDADGIKRAIRVLPFSDARMETVKHEIEAVALYRNQALPHLHLLDILYCGVTETCRYYVTPLADNAAEFTRRYRPLSLSVRIAANDYSDEEALNFIEDILAGVAHLHARGIAHGDLKPENIIFVDRQLKIGDPGLISMVEHKSPSGSTGYLVPWRGADGVVRDIYAIGKIIYSLYTGNPADKFPELTRNLRTNHAAELNDITLRCCDEAYAQRFKSVQEIQKAVAVLRSNPPTLSAWHRFLFRR